MLDTSSLCERAEKSIDNKFTDLESAIRQFAKINVSLKRYDTSLIRLQKTTELYEAGSISEDSRNLIFSEELEKIKISCNLLKNQLGIEAKLNDAVTLNDIVVFRRYATFVKRCMIRRIKRLIREDKKPIDLKNVLTAEESSYIKTTESVFESSFDYINKNENLPPVTYAGTVNSILKDLEEEDY